MDIESFEKSFEDLKDIEEDQASYPREMSDPDLALIAVILNFIAAQMNLVIQSNLEIWKLLESLTVDVRE